MPRSRVPYRVDLDAVGRLWFNRQGLLRPRRAKLTRRAFVDHLERTGGLQLDTVNVLDRAHYLTLWSRFGPYDRKLVDRWVYRDRLAFEGWGHVTCILPMSRLPLSRRGMRRFDPQGEWWEERRPTAAAMQRVRQRIRQEGALESAHFESESGSEPWWGWKVEKQALEWLWRRGKLAVSDRRHFRRVYDLAERVYPKGPIASATAYEDGWLLTGLSGNGIASEKHLRTYFTAPRLKAAERQRVIDRNLRKKRVVEVEVETSREPHYALPEHLEGLGRLSRPEGTTLLCPFDSFLWQRERAEDLLDFHYRVEIYVPAAKRQFGYYCLPILHDGALVGRLDPKLHRDRNLLEIKSIHLETGFRRDDRFDTGLARSLRDLAAFVGADRISLPRGWRQLGA